MATQPTSFLTRLDPREVWELEPTDFTPWLEQEANLAELARSLRMEELEVVRREQPIGRKSADLVARGRDGLVLIENQLGETDHKHLGQVLTYLAGLEGAGLEGPVRAVWIATAVGEEHEAAIDWLNEHTPEHFAFFAVELRAYRIGESPAAPQFHVVAAPNTWARRAAAKTRDAIRSGGDPHYNKYWSAMAELMPDPGPFRGLTPPKGNWWEAAFGVSRFRLSMSAPKTRGSIRSECYFEKDPTNVVIGELQRSKDQIEEAFGEALAWEPLDNTAWRIASYDYDADVMNESEWPNQAAWYADRNKRLQAALLPYLRSLDVAALLREAGAA